MMTDRLIDLSDLATHIPTQLVFDSSAIIEWLVAVETGDTLTRTRCQQHVVDFVIRHQAFGGVGLITPQSLIEVWHFLIKGAFHRLLPEYLADLRQTLRHIKRPAWQHLYKAYPHLLQRFAPELHRTLEVFSAAGFVLLQPHEMYRAAAEQPFEAELLAAIERYELDSVDAAIVLEAQHAGVPHLVTLDRDVWRAQLDLHVYSWLN